MCYAFDLEPQYKIKCGRRFAAASERHILDLSDLGIPEVPLVGRYEYHSAHPGLHTHTHPSTLEVCYLARGKQTYRVGGRQFHLTGGDVFVTLPDEPHDTAGQPEDPGILYWINVRMPKRGGSLLTLPARHSAILTRELLNLPERHFAGSPALKLILEEVFDLYNRPDDPLKRIAIVNLMVRYLLEVVSCARRHPYMRLSHALAQIVEMIHSHPEENHLLADLADQAGLSLSRFKARFKAEVGTAPHEYILRIKIEAARKLLRDQLPVTEVAMQLGFDSSQYFATVFKRFCEQTPRDFQKSGPVVPLRPA
jgi:AraC-like DNA-binding protein